MRGSTNCSSAIPGRPKEKRCFFERAWCPLSQPGVFGTEIVSPRATVYSSKILRNSHPCETRVSSAIFSL